MPLSLAESNYLVCVALALPHFLYAFIWFFPQRWMALFKKRSVEAFETVAWFLKGAEQLAINHMADIPVPCSPAALLIDDGDHPIWHAGVQFLSVAYWWLLRKPDGVALSAIPPLGWAVGLPVAAFGQVGS